MTTGARPLRVAMIGQAFMGRAHSHAWRTAPRFFDLPLAPELAVVVGRDPGRAAAFADRWGWAESSDDWREVVTRDDIDLVDICTPGDTHAEIAVAALDAGKHVLCEKPLANSVAEAETMAAAARRARPGGVLSMVGFTYRRVPAIALARSLVAQGRIGTVRQVQAQYLQDWLTDPSAPMSWRLDAQRAGSGALGDIGAHIIDLTQHITGDRLVEVTARLSTFVTERPTPDGAGTGRVTVDDAASFLATFGSGATGVFSATRVAAGRKNSIRIEITGSTGSIAFDFEDMNVLQYCDFTEGDTAGFRSIIVTEPGHPYVGAWWPPGHGLGYEHGFTHQVVDLVRAIADGSDAEPDFAAGVQVQRVLAAVQDSADSRRWHSIPTDPGMPTEPSEPTDSSEPTDPREPNQTIE